MSSPEPLVFCLYLAGNTPVSARAVVNTRRFCEEHLDGRYELEIVDISLHPERVREAQIIAAPTPACFPRGRGRAPAAPACS